jgi:hypothetical protein
MRPGAGNFCRQQQRRERRKEKAAPTAVNIHGHAVEYDVKSNHAVDVIKMQELSSKDIRKLIGQRKK